MKVSRKTFIRLALLGAPGLALTGALYGNRVGARWLDNTRKTLPLRHLKKPIRVLHLSDFHASPEVPYQLIEAAVTAGLRQRPDIACLTGDFYTHDMPDPARFTEILGSLSARVPTFACLGNHDGGPWTHAGGRYPEKCLVHRVLTAAGARLLLNETARVEAGGQALDITGLGDIWMADMRPRGVLHERRPEPVPRLVLAHNPDTKDALMGLDWDLMLSGHTHGGQLVLPLLGYRPFLPVQDRSLPEGIRSWDGPRHIHVTRGVGNILGYRFNCRPEVSILDLRPL